MLAELNPVVLLQVGQQASMQPVRRSIAQQLWTCPSLPQTASHQTQQVQVPCCCPQSPSSVAPACCRLVSGPAKRYRHAASRRSAAQQQQAQEPHAIIPNIVAVLHGLFPEMEDKVGRRRTLRILQTCIQGRPRLKVSQAAPRRRHPTLTHMVCLTLATQRWVQKWWLCCDRLHLGCGFLKLCCSTAAQCPVAHADEPSAQTRPQLSQAGFP